LKNIHPDELEKAIFEIDEKGYYNADEYNRNYRRLLKQSTLPESSKISEQELKFLQYACTDLTYKAIAAKMHLAERTIDGYRESLFDKLNVQSRVGMALEAVRRKLVELLIRISNPRLCGHKRIHHLGKAINLLNNPMFKLLK
jgi:DNA-binding NarL/FixJ family response regulator